MIKFNDKLIVLSLATLLLFSFIFLAAKERHQQDYDYQKNWWALYFEDVKNDNFDFIIENYSEADNFRWAIISGKNKPSKEGTIRVQKGESKNIIVKFDDPQDKKITIRVSSGKKSKEIFKDLRK
ncbi:hypothetical protein ACFLY1_00430 [Patescibacteria group bacterium]